MRFSPCFILYIVSVFSYMGCVSNQVTEQVAGSGDSITIINFVSGTNIFDAVKLFERDDLVPDMTVRIFYPDHESEVEIGGLSADETANEVLFKEEELLSFLVTQFDSSDRRESRVHNNLAADLDGLREASGLEVRWVTMRGEYMIEDESIDTVFSIRLPFVETEQLTASGKSITDYTGDASYTPAGGTSTVYTSGTLQKFWMDEDSADAFVAVSDGLEMDTVISSRSYAKCGSSTSSNMPDYYKDTEAFDWWGSSSAYRNCSIGTLSADELVEDDLYWTWHSFSSFSSSKNPRILINFQPTTWGSAVLSETMCAVLGAWCMYSRSDMPTESMIIYNYNDAPSVEEEWVKD